jgi:type IV secretion system protein TrbJ
MDEETRAGFDDMRRGFAEISARFDGVDRRFDRVDQRFAEVDRRFDQVDQRFADVDGRLVEANRGTTEVSQRVDTLEERVMREIRQLGVISEDLRSQIQLVAEGVVGNGRAIERLRVEMNERFRENEVIVGGAFRQIRRDLDELRDDRS